MSVLPADWFGLMVVVYLLGMRHGMDADHLATIDGFTRANQIARPEIAGWSGILFSLGHGVVVIAVSVLVGLAAAEWATPNWLDATGTWISVLFLIGLGAVNIVNVLIAEPSSVVRTIGLRSGWTSVAGGVNHPVMIVGTGAMFALSFDTVSQVALFSLSAKATAGIWFCMGLGATFMLGMMTTDGINGLWISRLLQKADRRARVCSRVMGLTIGATSLLVGIYGAARETMPEVAAFAEGYETGAGLMVVAVVLGSFLLAVRLSAPDSANAFD